MRDDLTIDTVSAEQRDEVRKLLAEAVAYAVSSGATVVDEEWQGTHLRFVIGGDLALTLPSGRVLILSPAAQARLREEATP